MREVTFRRPIASTIALANKNNKVRWAIVSSPSPHPVKGQHHQKRKRGQKRGRERGRASKGRGGRGIEGEGYGKSNLAIQLLSGPPISTRKSNRVTALNGGEQGSEDCFLSNNSMTKN